MFLSTGGAEVFMNLKKNKEKEKQEVYVALWVKEWIRKSLSVVQSMYDESQINEQERESW